MFERFTDGAREALVLAQAEASALRHHYLGTEHLLLGIARVEPSVSGRVLRRLGIEPDDLRGAIVQRIGLGPREISEADAEALRTLGIDIDVVRRRIEETFGPGALDRPARWRRSRRCGRSLETPGHIPFTPRAKKVLELALREARRLGHNYVGSEHVLLGVVRANEGVAAEILADVGATDERVRRAVIEELSWRIEPPSASA